MMGSTSSSASGNASSQLRWVDILGCAGDSCLRSNSTPQEWQRVAVDRLSVAQEVQNTGALRK